MKQARVLTASEIKRVIAVCAAGKHGQRNRLAIMLSHYAGLRVGEIASLYWEQLLESDGSIKAAFYLEAENTKSGEARAVHLNPQLMKELGRFKHTVSEHYISSTAIIRSQKGKAFSANSLCQLFSRIYSAAGINGASSHSGRRWFITKLAHGGFHQR